MYDGDYYETGIEESGEWRYAKGIDRECAFKDSEIAYDSYTEVTYIETVLN